MKQAYTAVILEKFSIDKCQCAGRLVHPSVRNL
jgi:hypothetical protein